MKHLIRFLFLFFATTLSACSPGADGSRSAEVDSGVVGAPDQVDSGRVGTGSPGTGTATGTDSGSRRDAGRASGSDYLVRGDFSSIPTIRAYYVGHSLNSDIPDFAAWYSNQMRAESFSFREQFIPGAALAWQWNESESVGIDEFTHEIHSALGSGEYSHMVFTDSVPRGGTEMEEESILYLGRIVDAARAARPDVVLYYYETWHHITSGLPGHDPLNEDQVSPTRFLEWRARLEADGPMWERIVARVNEEHPAGPNQNELVLIPAGRILGEIVDRIDNGEIPGFESLGDLFSDEIHTNHYAKMVIGAIHAAVLTRRDPRDYDIDAQNRHGGPYWDEETWDGFVYPRPSEVAVERMMETVYQEVEAAF